jgi:hypothetical protein
LSQTGSGIQADARTRTGDPFITSTGLFLWNVCFPQFGHLFPSAMSPPSRWEVSVPLKIPRVNGVRLYLPIDLPTRLRGERSHSQTGLEREADARTRTGATQSRPTQPVRADVATY